MTSHIKDLVNDALELPSERREHYLTRLCHDDAALLEEARDMLAAHARLGRFLEPEDDTTGLWARALRASEPSNRTPALVGAVLDGRYQLEERMGTGASGVVYEASDLLTGDQVAVKILTIYRHGDLSLFRRELTALRLLELPGVVRLLDDGVHAGLPFLVMPRIDGVRFPGRRAPVPWEELAETAIALFETVARIHAHGVVHGDLKPANVLVDATGLPVVLDLGVSSGPSVPGRLEGIAGTPAYLAPEQLQGDDTTPHTDLYATGIMLYEALTGHPPHSTRSFHELMKSRIEIEPPKLAEAGVDPDRCPCGILDALLARRPSDRPQSAAHVAAVLRGELPPLDVLRAHPVLQLDETVDEIVEAAARASVVALHGPPHSGRSLCLRRAAGRLRRAGKSVAWLHDGAGGAPPHVDVLIVDDPHLEVEAGSSVVIRLVDAPEQATIRIRPLAEEALRELFGGSDRLFHLREDSARELHRRTRGWPARVVEELSAWIRAGLARVESRSVVVERAALDLLAGGFRVCPVAPATRPSADPVLGVLATRGTGLSEAELATALDRPAESVSESLAELTRQGWVDRREDGRYLTTTDVGHFPGPREHAAAARALAPGTPGRLRHVVASEAPRAVAAEARAEALALVEQGHVGHARAVITEGLASVRGHELGVADELPLLSALLIVAAAEGTERGFELALYELGRATARPPAVGNLEQLARVGLLALRRDGDRALALADALEPFDDIELEQFRQSARALAARSGQRDRSEEVLASVEAWASDRDAELVRCKLREWQGWALYVQGRFGEAASRQEEALALAPDPRTRLSALLNVAETMIETGRYDRACELANEALSAAAEVRHPFYEARAESVLRFAAYRSGRADAVDHELIDAMRSLHVSNLEAQLCLNEGAVAWRLDDLTTARRLVRRANRLWSEVGHLWTSLLTHGFLAALGETADVDRIEESVHDCPLPGVALQTFALLARRFPDRASRYREDAIRFAEHFAPEYRDLRREVASVTECLAWLDRA